MFNVTDVFLRSEEKEISVLQKKYADLPDDTTRVIFLNEIAKAYSNLFYDSAVLYAQRAMDLAGRAQYPKGLVAGMHTRGYAEEIMRKNWDSAIVYYRMAIVTARKNKMDALLDDLYSIIHNAYVYQGNFPMAMATAREGLARATAKKDRKQMLHYTSLVAASYFRQNLYDQALTEFKEAETIAAELKKEKREAVNLVTLADIYYGLGNVYAAAGDSVQALIYLEKAHDGFNTLRQDTAFIREYMISNTLYKKGLVYQLSGDYNKSLGYVLAALDSCKTTSCNPYEKAVYYLLAGDALRGMGDYEQSRRYLYEGKRIAEEIRHAEDARDAYYYLSLFYADKKNYDSAWYFNQMFLQLKDSITNERTRFRTEEISAIYGIAEKDRKIARQNNLRNILVATFIVLLLTLGFLYNRYRLRQRNRYQQELNRQQNELFNAISLAQEQERKRIAQDIHDSLGSVLSAAKLKMVEVKERRPELAADDKFTAGIGLIDEASSELRNISHNIMPATLSKLGLVPALKSLAEKISSHKGLQVQFSAHEFETRLEEQTEISIYRIILELINNVVKHAAASKATVQLVRYPDHINITVEDNGKGFDMNRTADDRTGIGLGSVAARVDYLKGTMDIDSMPGKGTTVIVDLPVRE